MNTIYGYLINSFCLLSYGQCEKLYLFLYIFINFCDSSVPGYLDILQGSRERLPSQGCWGSRVTSFCWASGQDRSTHSPELNPLLTVTVERYLVLE